MSDYQQGSATPASGSRPTGSSQRLWWRFRRLPLAVQVFPWVAAIVLLAAIGTATGGKNLSLNPGARAASKAANTVTPHAKMHALHTKKTKPTTTTATPNAARPTSPTVALAPSQAAGSTGGCRSGDSLANVYRPYRVQVRSACMTVTGTVAFVRHEDDGDVHLNLSLPAGESHLLDQANYSYENGELVTEIVPADQPGCSPGQPPPLPSTAYRSPSYNYGLCTGADIPTPPLGGEVSVIGPYVLDSDHGWMEIHPVWALTVIATPPTPSTTTQSPPPAPDTEPPQPAGTTANASCNASATPSNDGYPGDYQVYVQSKQPDSKATASDSADSWSGYTDSSGSADIRLYQTSAGMTITVTVGAASCSTTAYYRAAGYRPSLGLHC